MKRKSRFVLIASFVLLSAYTAQAGTMIVGRDDEDPTVPNGLGAVSLSSQWLPGNEPVVYDIYGELVKRARPNYHSKDLQASEALFVELAGAMVGCLNSSVPVANEDLAGNSVDKTAKIVNIPMAFHREELERARYCDGPAASRFSMSLRDIFGHDERILHLPASAPERSALLSGLFRGPGFGKYRGFSSEPFVAYEGSSSSAFGIVLPFSYSPFNPFVPQDEVTKNLYSNDPKYRVVTTTRLLTELNISSFGCQVSGESCYVRFSADAVAKTGGAVLGRDPELYCSAGTWFCESQGTTTTVIWPSAYSVTHLDDGTCEISGYSEEEWSPKLVAKNKSDKKRYFEGEANFSSAIQARNSLMSEFAEAGICKIPSTTQNPFVDCSNAGELQQQLSKREPSPANDRALHEAMSRWIGSGKEAPGAWGIYICGSML